MARLTLVTNEIYKNNNGEIVKNATWHSLIAWGRCEGRERKWGRNVELRGLLS